VIPDRVEVRDLYVAATQHGLQIRRMHQRRDSLEDIFLRAMSGETMAQRAGNLGVSGTTQAQAARSEEVTHVGL
jgi:hypothetical protein